MDLDVQRSADYEFSCVPIQLEERIDTLSKEARAHKTATEAAQLQIAELREELKQVRIIHMAYKLYFGTLAVSCQGGRVV